MTPAIEVLAAALLLANVWLVARRSLWSYAFGIAAVLLYASVFLQSRLYAAFALQLLFLALNIWGLVNWRHAMADGGDLPIGRLGWRPRAATAIAVALLAAATALILVRTTDAVAPWWDAGNTAASLAAQWWQARRMVDTWPLWLLVNLSSVGLYAAQQLWFTAATYALLLLVALKGWRDWAAVAR